MKKFCAALVLGCFFTAVSHAASLGDSESTPSTTSDTLWDAVKNGHYWLSMRSRYENVDQDNTLSNGEALTLRTLLGYQSAQFKGFSSLVELANVSSFVDNYNSGGVTTSPMDLNRSVIADPRATVVNQAYLQYDGIQNASFKVGRQVITLDNHRFVGNVGFRQTEQRYDAASASYTPVEWADLYYAYVWRVDRIFGPDAVSPLDEYDSNSQFFNVALHIDEHNTLTPYTYLIDNENSSSTSNDTYGLRFEGSYMFKNDFEGLYEAEYAYQTDAYNNTTDYTAHYYSVVAGVRKDSLTGKLGYEVLGEGDGGIAFQTPYATGHRFNGWADVFLTTPAGGLHDAYATVIKELDSYDTKILATYHNFTSDDSTGHYGSEVDFGIYKKVCGVLTLGLEYADFFGASTTDGFVDTQKIWLTASAKFA